jgi:hypothetical protein
VLDGAADTDLELEHASMVDEGTGLRSLSDEESDDESEISAGPQLEPRRPHDAETPIQDFTAADTTDDDPTQADRDPTHGVRGLAERQLEQEPFVIPYPSRGQGVGDPVGASREQSAHANMSYELEIAPDKTNPYAPFASQLDWDIAKWAKLRGPGCTSFGEMMNIPGVRTSLLCWNLAK